MSGGYWHSANLADWTFVPSSLGKLEQYAPDVRVIDGKLRLTASGDCPVYRAIDPLNDEWEQIGEHPLFMDPSCFQDDDSRVYLYFGATYHYLDLSRKKPLKGLNPCYRKLNDQFL